ncbi:hypothetical protein AB0N06_08895 [Streptomyces sp. NPDC051020]|uniref:hypothetical protein n=1 Tax=Streptomyces sp. NPDC051020 TaxID=3155409 RepID=UPI003419DF8A
MPSWNRCVCLPGHEGDIRDAAAWQRVLDSGVEPEIVWSELAAYVAGADLVVAYNGSGRDFPLVRDAAARAGCHDPFAGTMLVDALIDLAKDLAAGRGNVEMVVV